MKLKKIFLIILALVVLYALYYLIHPLFTSKKVDESFPDQKTQSLEEDLSSKQDQAQATVENIELIPVKVGDFSDADRFHKGSGSASLYKSDKKSFLRFENFEVTNGPDLHVLLAKHPNPKSPEELESLDYLDLGKLKGNIGDQNYQIESSENLDAFKSVVIYCDPFHVIFSTASLQ